MAYLQAYKTSRRLRASAPKMVSIPLGPTTSSFMPELCNIQPEHDPLRLPKDNGRTSHWSSVLQTAVTLSDVIQPCLNIALYVAGAVLPHL